MDRQVDRQVTELEAAIARLTRSIASAADEVIPDLVTERREMREELRRLREATLASADVIPIGARTKR